MPKTVSKKGGGKKAAGMTEEERVFYMQHRAQAEEETARKKEEMLKEFLKDKLQKEQKNSAVNLHKLNEQWRTVLRLTRSEELRNDLAVHSQNFERMLDYKDNIIQGLKSDLVEAEQQSAQALGAHLTCMDRLLSLQQERLAFLQQQWDTSVKELNSEFTSQSDKVSYLNEQDSSYLEDVTSGMERQYNKLFSAAQEDYQNTRFFLKNLNMEMKSGMNVQLKRTLAGLWSQVEEVHENYNKTTAHINCDLLLSQDKQSNQEIKAQMKKLQKLKNTISMLKTQSDQSDLTAELRATKEETSAQIVLLKAQCSQAKDYDSRCLRDLANDSHAAIKKLQGIVAKGERILGLAKMCRRLETEHEKVFPFPTSSLNIEQESQEDAVEQLSSDLQEMLDSSDLGRFWQRYNKVKLEVLSLKKESKVLREENKHLQGLLHQHLDGISLNGDMLHQHDPLFVVSQPVTAMQATAARERNNHNVIEAAHVIKHTL